MMKTLRTWAPLGLMVTGAFVTGVLVRGQGAATGDAVLRPVTHDVAKELAMKITAQTQQPDNMEALLATARFEGGKLVEARLHPVDIGIEYRPTSKAGNPTTPTPESARRILAKVQMLSKPFGTTMAVENGVGVIRVAPASTQ